MTQNKKKELRNGVEVKLARRKTTTKTEEKEPSKGFDYAESLNTMQVSSLLKAGFGYYIEVNNLTFNSEKELEKEFNKFKQMNAGV